MMTLVLRFTHVFFAALWVGMMAYQTFFLMPVLGEVGADSGKLMAALMRRKIPQAMLGAAILAIVSGFWLFQRMAGGNAGALMQTAMGKGFAFGGAAALLAFLPGLTVVRPAMMKAARLGQSGGAAAGPEIQRLRARGATYGYVVAFLLLFALAAMAVARYL